MIKRITMLFLVSFMTLTIWAQEKGLPVFQDFFDTKDTFAENWISKGSGVKPEKGRVRMLDGNMRPRREMSGTFYAEAEFTLQASPPSATAGFKIAGFRFAIQPNGEAGLIKDGMLEKPFKIEGFTLGKAVKLTLIREVDGDKAKYIFRVNGKEAATATESGALAKPLYLFSDKAKLTLDEFALFSVRKANESPNMVINSGFEYQRDGYPPYYRTPRFNLNKIAQIPYEQFIASVSQDKSEKHSGEYSLKVVNDGSTGGGSVVPQNVGTVLGASGVFSVWMKADQDDFPVTISYGGGAGRKTVKVGKEWERYEVVNPSLPKPGIFSPAAIFFRKEGTLWVDDLQAEFIAAPTEDELKSGKTFATPYQPSELDKSRFGEKKAETRLPKIIVPKLPTGIDPIKGLEVWMNDATKVDAFYNGERQPKNKTEGYFACDDRNFYVGCRCYVDDLKKAKETPNYFSKTGEVIEILTESITSGKQLASFQFQVDANNSRSDRGQGMDSQWEGDWQSSVQLNEKTKTVDFTLVIPFSEVAHPEMKTNWIMNLHRYNPVAKETLTLVQSTKASFRNSQLWPFVQLPEDAVKPFAIGVSGGGYSSSSVTLDLVNNSGRERRVMVKVTAGDTTKEKDVTLKKGANSVSLPIIVKNPKVAVKLEENGLPLANQLCFLEKRDPVSMLGRLSFYMNEPEALFRVGTTVPNPEKFTAVLSCGTVSVKKKADAKFQIALPLKDIPVGTHKVTLTLVDKDGKTVSSGSSEFIKRPFKDGASQINHFSRSLLHNGKPVAPFAPLVILIKRSTKKDADNFIALLDKYDFRYAWLLLEIFEPKDKDTIALYRYFMDEANKKGIKIILWQKYDQLSDEGRVEAIKLAQSTPNVLAHMVLDEPEISPMTSDFARDYVRKIRPLFPYQPTLINYTVLGIPARYADLETDILVLDDYLTNQETRSVASLVCNADIMREVGAADGKPSWIVLVSNGAHYVRGEVTYGEQIAQVYGCLAAGCTGFAYYEGWPATPGNWRAYLQLNREIQALTDIVCSEEEIASASTTGNSELLRCLTKKHDGYVYLITCNIDSESAGAVTMTLPKEFTYADEVEVLFEDRKIPVKNGKFSDEFPGHQRHVYKVGIKQ